MSAIAANLKLRSRRKGVGIREYAERLCVGTVESWSLTANIERPQMPDIGTERKASAGQRFHRDCEGPLPCRRGHRHASSWTPTRHDWSILQRHTNAEVG